MRHVRSHGVCAAVLIAGMLGRGAKSPRGQPPAPARPYKPVTITPPTPMTDAGFEAMRKQIGEAAQRKDRAALARLVVAHGFFWQRENRNRADKRKSGFDNLSAALGLNNKDGAGWDILSGYADDPTASPSPGHKGAICAPAEPAYDAKEFAELIKATQTDVTEWGYPVSAGIEVHATRAGQRAGDRQTRPAFRARHAGERAGLRRLRAHRHAERQEPAMSRSIPSRRSATTSSATSRTAAPGRSAAISAAASRSNVTVQP